MKSKKLLIVSTIMIIFILGGAIMLFSKYRNLLPEKKYEEFPFSLTYKIDDNVLTINNTYVCEYGGIGWNTSHGFYRKWTGYVKETGLENVLIADDSERQIFCRVGDPQYYMETTDTQLGSIKTLSPPHLYTVKKSNNFDYISVEEIKQKYNIEILSWDFSQPIHHQ